MGILAYLSTASKWEFAGIVLVAFIIYELVSVVYRLTLHPFAKYPGPVFNCISWWPECLSASSGNRHIERLRQHEIYGPIVRCGPDMLSFNTESALKTIYLSPKANVQKGWWYEGLHSMDKEYTTHSMINRQYHACRRRVMSHAFSDNALRNAEDFVLQNVRKFLKAIDEPKPGDSNDGWTRKRDMASWFTYLSFDIMGDLAYGKSFNCLASESSRWVPELMIAASKFGYPLGFCPLFPVIRLAMGTKLIEEYGGEIARKSAKFLKYTHDLMNERIEKLRAEETKGGEITRKDVFYYLIKARDPETGKGYTQKELEAESSVIVVGGSDTTSTTLSAALFYLARNPRVKTKLAKEVREAFHSIEDIKMGSILFDLKYLRAVIDESLRMSPPVASVLQREVLPGGLEVDGHYLPGGTQVGVSAYAIHHNEAYFPDAFTFKPERWIVDPENGVTEQSVHVAQNAFCAFSLGSRACIGKYLAYLEMSIILARLMWQFDLREAQGEQVGGGNDELGVGRRRRNEYQIYDWFVAHRKGPFIEFKARTSPGA